MKTVAEKMGKKLFQCAKCRGIKKKKHASTQTLGGEFICKNCLKPPEPVPSADYHR